MACDVEGTSYIIAEKVKREGKWTTYDDYFLEFKIWEMRTSDPDSNQVAIRYTGKLHWVSEPVIPGMKEKVSSEEHLKMWITAQSHQ